MQPAAPPSTRCKMSARPRPRSSTTSSTSWLLPGRTSWPNDSRHAAKCMDASGACEYYTARSRTCREPRGGRWGQGLTAEKMKNQWLRPVLVGNSGSWNGRRTLTCGIRNSSRSGRIRCSRDAGCQARKDLPPVLFFTTTKLKSEYTGPYHTTR
jgi:hypothetical protein